MGTTTINNPRSAAIRERRVAAKNDVIDVYERVNLSSSYATGGETLAQPQSRSRRGKLLSVEVINPFTGTYIIAWNGDVTTPKLLVYTALPGTQVANATNVSTVQVLVKFVYEGGM